ncbi:MAG: arginine decarboxylase, pyruvoyl-dependent [Methanobacteriaceae archaeon]|jgi:arginine decarboxylase|nr:arginine decarboxylase, pyruvoyl-dependent [Candidatus Methanorudis spinitermitis]
MKIAIVSGKAEGPTKLNSFDNALLDAGIGNVNLIKVSSMLEENTEIIKLPKLSPGSMVNCVLSCVSSDEKGDLISAAVAVAIGNNLGCVVENSKVNKNPEEVIKESINMVKYMMKIRGETIHKLIVEEINHVVGNIGTVVASVIYL